MMEEWKEIFVEVLEDITNYGGWSDKIHVCDQLSEEMNTFNNSIAFFINEDVARIALEVQKRLSITSFHVIRGVFFSRQHVTYQVNDRYPFTEHINSILHWLNAGGFLHLWRNAELSLYKERLWLDMATRASNTNNKSSDFRVPTVIWCGWIGSVAVLVCEIIWNKIASYTLKRRAKVRVCKRARMLIMK